MCRLLSELDSALLHPRGREGSWPTKMRLATRRGTRSRVNLISRSVILERRPFQMIGTVSEYYEIGTDFHRAQMNKSSHCCIVTQGK